MGSIAFPSLGVGRVEGSCPALAHLDRVEGSFKGNVHARLPFIGGSGWV
jgi:hypothetical protein